MVQAHQKQIVAWEEDRQRVSNVIGGHFMLHTIAHFISMEIKKINTKKSVSCLTNQGRSVII